MILLYIPYKFIKHVSAFEDISKYDTQGARKLISLYLLGVGCSSQRMAEVWGHPYSLLLQNKKQKDPHTFHYLFCDISLHFLGGLLTKLDGAFDCELGKWCQTLYTR